MARHKVTVFEPYPFQAGQKIHIEEGPRRGDWEVISVTDRKVTLRCPVSLREIEWDRFCYFVREGENIEWPKQD
jgi:hypothetical protein